MWDWNTYILFLAALAVSYPFFYKYDHSENDKGNKWLVMALIPTLLLLALRGDTVGQDLVRYAVHIRRLDLSGFSFSLLSFSEPLFGLIYYISSKLDGLHSFIIITSVIEYFFIGLSLKIRQSKGESVSLMFYMIFGFIVLRSFSMVSNGIAIACSLCAYAYLDDIKNWKKYAFFSLLALGFHNSAVVNILIYVCCRQLDYETAKERNKAVLKRVLAFVLFSVALYIISKGMLDSLISSINNGSYNSIFTRTNFGIGNILVRLPLFIIALLMLNDLKQENGVKIIPYFLLLITDIGIAQMKYIANDFERFTMYSGIGSIYMSVYIVQYLKKRIRGFQIIVFISIIIYITYYLYHWAVTSNYGIMPYKIWSFK